MARKIDTDVAGMAALGEYVAQLRLRQARLIGIGDRLRQTAAELANLVADTQRAHSRMQAAGAPESTRAPQ